MKNFENFEKFFKKSKKLLSKEKRMIESDLEWQDIASETKILKNEKFWWKTSEEKKSDF